MKRTRRKISWWHICIILVFLLTALGLSPAVIPPGLFKPALLGFPYSLWMGMLVTICLVLMTFIGAIVHPGNKKDDK